MTVKELRDIIDILPEDFDILILGGKDCDTEVQADRIKIRGYHYLTGQLVLVS